MPENLVYLREAKGLPSVEAQQEAIRAAGVPGVDPERDRAYLDRAPKRRAADGGTGLPERDLCVRACRRGAGDVVYVAAPDVAGVSLDDALTFLKALGERGASLHVVSEGETYRWSEDGAAMVRLAQRIASAASLRRSSLARQKAAERQARDRAAQAKAWKLAEEMWPAQKGHTLAQIVKATGIPARTLYNAQKRGELPERGAQPFTGGPKLKAAKPRRRST